MNEEKINIKEDPKPKGSYMREILDYLEIFVVAVSCVLLLFTFCFRFCIVDGPSMENTLYNGERLFVSDLFYTPKGGDIVVFHQSGGGYDKLLVKRVIAVEGETVHIEYSDDSMTVSITDANGASKGVIVEDYIKYVDSPLYTKPMTFEVEEGTVFVMGDNRNHSADSRAASIGLVDEREIIGKVVFRMTPVTRFGSVY